MAARRKLTAKQIAAGFGGKRRKAARRSGKKLTRKSSKKVRTMPRRSRRSTSRKYARRTGKTLAVGGMLPVLNAARVAILGDAANAGLKQSIQSYGPGKGLLNSVDSFSHTLTGFKFGLASNGASMSFDAERAVKSAGLAVGGIVAHKIAGATKVNAGLRKMQRAVGFRKAVVI